MSPTVRSVEFSWRAHRCCDLKINLKIKLKLACEIGLLVGEYTFQPPHKYNSYVRVYCCCWTHQWCDTILVEMFAFIKSRCDSFNNHNKSNEKWLLVTISWSVNLLFIYIFIYLFICLFIIFIYQQFWLIWDLKRPGYQKSIACSQTQQLWCEITTKCDQALESSESNTLNQLFKQTGSTEEDLSNTENCQILKTGDTKSRWNSCLEALIYLALQKINKWKFMKINIELKP